MRAKWGKGIATRTALLSIQYGFKSLKLTSIFARTFSENYATQKVLEKVGFLLKGNIWLTDLNKNALHYELTV